MWQPITVISPHGVERHVRKSMPCWPDLNVKVLKIWHLGLGNWSTNHRVESLGKFRLLKEAWGSSHSPLWTLLASDFQVTHLSAFSNLALPSNTGENVNTHNHLDWKMIKPLFQNTAHDLSHLAVRSVNELVFKVALRLQILRQHLKKMNSNAKICIICI